MPIKEIRTRLQSIGLALVCASGTAAVPAFALEKLPTGDPCTVVPLATVQKSFPDAKAALRDRSVEKYGLTRCRYNDATGVSVFGVTESLGDYSAMEEAQSPLPQAKGVRYEKLSGLAPEAVAFVELADPKRGIPRDMSMLVMKKGQRILELESQDLPKRGRAAALKVLDELGRIAAKRLE